MRRLLPILALLWPLAATADFQAGLAAYDRGDFAVALAEWRPLAEKGDLRARFYLGVMYLRGEGVPRDIGRSYAWFDFAGAKAPAAPAKVQRIEGYPPAEFGRSVLGLRTAAGGKPAGTFTLDDAIGAYGKDYRRETLAGGKVRYSWTYVGHTLARVHVPAPPTTSAGTARGPEPQTTIITGSCVLTIVTDAKRRILEVTSKGNACASVLDQPRAWREKQPLYLIRPPGVRTPAETR